MSVDIVNLLNIPVYTVNRWITTGKLNGIKRLRRWYVKKADLIAFLKSENIDVPDELLSKTV